MTRKRFVRARTEEQKSLRIATIVDATARLLENRRFDEINISAIAREARFTRSNLYRYFATKEEVYLALLSRDIVRLRQNLEESFRRVRRPSAESFARRWSGVVSGHKRFAQLSSIVFPIIEKNASLEHMTRYKAVVKGEVSHFAGLISRLFPSLSDGEVQEILHLQYCFICGLYPAGHLSDKQVRAMEAAGLTVPSVDFEYFLRRSLEYIMNGYLG